MRSHLNHLLQNHQQNAKKQKTSNQVGASCTLKLYNILIVSTSSTVYSIVHIGTSVRLQFYQESQKPDPNTVYCQRTCKKRTNCMIDPSSTCSEEQFQVFLADQDRKNKKIKVGDRVAFRSMYRTLDWMDCSREGCELTYCSPDSICLQHQLEIHRDNQRTSSRIQTKDRVFLKAVGEDKYLNCAGTQCRLVAECEGSAQGSSSGESGNCGKRQLFSITKELECNDS